jgi:hypothetical protein
LYSYNALTCQIAIKIEFSRWVFSKNTQVSIIMQIHPVGAELFHAGGRADRQAEMTNQMIAFRSFANTTKKGEIRTGSHSHICQTVLNHTKRHVPTLTGRSHQAL